MSTTPRLFRALVDDAAVFPPGNAPLEVSVQRHLRHRAAAYAACVGPLLVPASAAAALLALLGAATDDPTLAVSVIGRPGTDPHEVVEAVRALSSAPTVTVSGAELGWHPGWRDLRLTVPAALEVPRGDEHELALDDIARAVGDNSPVVGKFRTGPTATWPWPDEDELAGVLRGFLDRSIPFKLTGGLHHAVRGSYPVAGVPEENHGVLNVLMATAQGLDGADAIEMADILGDRDGVNLADAFIRTATDADRSRQIRAAFTAYGCCEVTDPIGELTALGLLPPAHDPKDAR